MRSQLDIKRKSGEFIIDIDIFKKVQEILKEDTRVAPANNEIYLFSGIVKCGHCGSNLTRKSCSSKNGTHYYYYICLSNKNKTGCNNKMCFSVNKLEKVVLDSINSHIKNFIEVKKLAGYISDLSFKTSEINRLEIEKEKLIYEIKISEKNRLEMYEDLKLNLINEKEYMMLKEISISKEEKLNTRLSEIQKRYKALNSEKDIFSVYNDFDNKNSIKELSREIIISFIDKILIYDKNNVEIRFKYQAEYDLMLEKIRYAEVN